MNLISDILDKLEHVHKETNIDIIYAKGIGRSLKVDWYSNKTYVNSDKAELQLELLKFNVNDNTMVDIFIRMTSNKIRIWVKSENTITEHNIDKFSMNYRSQYNLLLEIVENIIKEPIEDFTDKTIKFMDVEKYRSDIGGTRYDQS